MLFGSSKIVYIFIFCCTLLFVLYATLHEDEHLAELAQANNNMLQLSKNKLRREDSECKLSYGHYGGTLWTKEGETCGRTCLLESTRMRVDHHKRLLPDGSTIDDWLWIDYGDRVNVLVREKSTDDGEGKFMVFEQTKYALEGPSWAVVGGFLEAHESPETAALREVREELQFHCNFHNLKSLGRYRTDVNRGLGWVHGFLAQDCVRMQETRHINAEEAVTDADFKQEAQALRSVSLDELEAAVRSGKFVEVQWTAAVALALLHLKDSTQVTSA